MQKITTIGDVSISAEWENNRVILTLENHGQNQVEIDIRYQQAGDPGTRSLRYFRLVHGARRTVYLLEGLKKYQKFYFTVGTEKPWPDSIEILKKVLDEVEKQAKIRDIQHGNEQLSTEPEQQRNFTLSYEKPSDSLEHEIRNQQEDTISKLQNKITVLEQITAEHQKEIDRVKKLNAELSQENSELKRCLDTQKDAMSREPEHVFREAAHQVLQTLFEQHQKDVGETPQDPIQICRGIETEVKKFEEHFDGQMTYALSVARDHITKIKGLIQLNYQNCLHRRTDLNNLPSLF